MKDNLYTQVKLIDEAGNTEIAWVPSDIAILEKWVSFPKEGSDVRYRVADVYPGSLRWGQVNERGQDYKKTREASDV